MAESTGGGHPIRLVVGLGNPGRQYAKTRHNVGFLVVEQLASREGAEWKTERKWKAEAARRGARIFLKPQTYMNLSGRSVAAAASFYKIDPSEILVVYDDVDLPLGALRFRTSGSAGGHNGIKSIMACLGTQEFGRLKFGIGRGAGEVEEDRPDRDLTGHVLGKFGVEEQSELDKSLDRAVEAVNHASSSGLEAAMNEFNRRPDRKNKPEKSEQKPAPEEQREEDDL